MKRTAKPRSRLSASICWRISRWTTTSSAVVGSSMITSSGSSASAIAMITRCRMPPESSCGYERVALRVDADHPQQLAGPRERVPLRDPLVRLHHVDELVADPHHRVERVHRALEDHRDVPPAEAAQLLPAQADQVLALEEDLPARDLRGLAQDLHDRVPGRRLAAAGLAGEADDLAGVDGEVDVVDRAHAPARDRVVDDELAELDERLRLHGGSVVHRAVEHVGHLDLLGGEPRARRRAEPAAGAGAARRRRRGFESSSTP